MKLSTYIGLVIEAVGHIDAFVEGLTFEVMLDERGQVADYGKQRITFSVVPREK